MHWTEAVNTSKVRMALRQTLDGRLMSRHIDGAGQIETYSSARRGLTLPEMRAADPHELEGYIDWSPATEFVASRVRQQRRSEVRSLDRQIKEYC